MPLDGKELYKRLKRRPTIYNEAIHCPLILEIMANSEMGTHSAFCKKVLISEMQFYNWRRDYNMFALCYSIGQMYSRENWEEMGREVRISAGGLNDRSFEYWRMIGWSRFGVGKNSRIRLNLKRGSNPAEHYTELLQQASEGDFTAGEIKQLMEAINVGLNAHQVFELQKQINELKIDLEKVEANKDVKNIHTD